MKHLYLFARTPPGLGRFKQVTPESNDLYNGIAEHITPEAIELYRNRKFIFTIPAEALDAWENTHQLDSLLDMVVKMDWHNYSAERWKISVEDSVLSDVLVRETYYISPKAFGRHDYGLAKQQAEEYDRRYILMVNSVVPFSEYKNDFINPEILLPFPVSMDIMHLDDVIK
ncbi:hypothetical protein KY312_01020 [Candidatus Woesearchaeota archaeon]|nr:hypothetical protein [Candidatus Woesearchaeota archaeon]